MRSHLAPVRRRRDFATIEPVYMFGPGPFAQQPATRTPKKGASADSGLLRHSKPYPARCRWRTVPSVTWTLRCLLPFSGPRDRSLAGDPPLRLSSLRRPALYLGHQQKAGRAQRSFVARRSARRCYSGFRRNTLGAGRQLPFPFEPHRPILATFWHRDSPEFRRSVPEHKAKKRSSAMPTHKPKPAKGQSPAKELPTPVRFSDWASI